MTHNHIQYVRSWLITGLIAGASLTFWSCSGEKKQTNAESTETTADSTVFGRQGDTTTNTLNAPQQAPVDSAPGAVVPAEVKVKPKN